MDAKAREVARQAASPKIDGVGAAIVTIVHVITAEASLPTLITTHISAYLPPLLPMLAGPVRNLYTSPSPPTQMVMSHI